MSAAAELEEMVGPVLMREIIGRFGGQELYIKPEPLPGDPLTVLLGQELAVKVALYFDRETIEIPMETTRRRVGRNRMICADRLNGATHRELVEKYGLCSRQIRNILSSGGVSRLK
ncbi:MAG: hypothetical protein KDI55_02370 [Anaerolineae bacterium]|nr:hypothetical protein [Anaerolineae bacterium]MCP5428582.1 hypothetical protein [Chromatiaceae bacterium]